MKYIKSYKLFESKKTFLDISGHGYKTIPLKLSDSLIYINCSQNNLSKLPNLPKNLEKLICSNNKLTELPELPKYLDELDVDNNKIIKLPKLPNTLISLDCSHNKLTELLKLPKNLENLYCFDNNWKEPLNFDIIRKFYIQPYTKNQKYLFNSENFQRKFLTEYPEKFKNLCVGDLEIHPLIRKEFSYLFEGEDMGFFDLIKENKGNDSKKEFIYKCIKLFGENDEKNTTTKNYSIELPINLKIDDNYIIVGLMEIKWTYSGIKYYYIFNKSGVEYSEQIDKNDYCLSKIYNYLIKKHPEVAEGDSMGFFDLKNEGRKFSKDSEDKIRAICNCIDFYGVKDSAGNLIIPIELSMRSLTDSRYFITGLYKSCDNIIGLTPYCINFTPEYYLNDHRESRYIQYLTPKIGKKNVDKIFNILKEKYPDFFEGNEFGFFDTK